MTLRAKRQTLAACCGLAAAVLLAGCGSDTCTAPTTPTPTPNPYPYDGYWVGTTSEGFRIVVQVVRNAVSHVRLSVRETSDCYLHAASFFTDAPIQNGTFTGTLDAGLLRAPAQMTGTITSPTSMSGWIGPMALEPGRCSTSTAAITFTATQ